MGISSKIEDLKDSKTAGTIRYMSPEQYEGIITFKSDIWSFGCVMLELITGKRPYDGIKMESFVSNSENPLDYFFENHKFEKIVFRKAWRGA